MSLLYCLTLKIWDSNMRETKFKKTEIGEISFNWDIKTLKEISSLITDGAHFSPKEVSVGYYMPSVKDMTSNGFDFSGCKKISQEDYLFLKGQGCEPVEGDVLIAKDGSMLKYAFSYKPISPLVILSSIAIIRPNKNVLPQYLALFFNKPEVVEYVVSNYKTGTGVPRIVLANFAKLPVALPSIEEQGRIAKALSEMDVLISSLNKLIEKKRYIKIATMQQLLTGKKRLIGFSEPWIECSIAEIFCIVGNNCVSRNDMSKSGNVRNIHYGDVLIKFGSIINADIEDLPFITGRDKACHPLCDGDIIMADTAEDETCGKVCEIRGVNDSMIESGLHTIALRPRKEFGKNFLGYYMNSEAFHDLLLPLMQGTKVTSISKSALMEVCMVVPSSVQEQKAIADIFTDMDAEISALESKKAKYESIKKGMMQELLTGKIRLV